MCICGVGYSKIFDKIVLISYINYDEICLNGWLIAMFHRFAPASPPKGEVVLTGLVSGPGCS
jgi:hypothetical protein